MQTFKKQQHSYRELLKGMQVCAHLHPLLMISLPCAVEVQLWQVGPIAAAFKTRLFCAEHPAASEWR